MWASRNSHPPVRSPGLLIGRWLALGGIGGAVVGAIVGLVIGLRTYLPTAPFAAGEAAVLGTFGGAVLGLLAGVVAALLGRRS